MFGTVRIETTLPARAVLMFIVHLPTALSPQCLRHQQALWKATLSPTTTPKKLRNLKVSVLKRDEDRLLVPRQSHLLDTHADESFDRFTSLCTRLFKVRCARFYSHPWSRRSHRDTETQRQPRSQSVLNFYHASNLCRTIPRGIGNR